MDAVEGTHHEVATHEGQSVVEAAGVVVGADGGLGLEEYLAFVYLVVEEEGGDAGAWLALDDGPVDGCGAAEARQERGVEVEGAARRHGPYRLGEHAESHYDEAVGLDGAQGVDEGGVAQLFGL